MVDNKILKRVALGVILFYSFLAQAQKNHNYYEEFEGFKKIGFYASIDYNRKTTFDAFQRSYSLSANNSLSYTLGFDYVYKPTSEFSFRTGLYLRKVPFFNFDINIPAAVNPANFADDLNDTFKTSGNLVFSVPIFYELKKQFGKNIFFSAIGGLDITILSKGTISTSVFVTDVNNDNSFEIFSAIAETNSFPLYPNLVLRPGFYFTGKKTIIHVSFIYQKALVPFFEGEFQFGNLIDAEPVRDDLRLSGDYFGIGLTVFLKKKKKKKSSSQYR